MYPPISLFCLLIIVRKPDSFESKITSNYILTQAIQMAQNAYTSQNYHITPLLYTL
jgi:hypothetical protein